MNQNKFSFKEGFTLCLKGLVAISVLLLSACNNSNTPAQPPFVAPKFFTVKVTNLTSNQPMSPLGVVLHNQGAFWVQNQPASVALETLAESGDNSALLAESFVSDSALGSSIITPGASQTVMVVSEDQNISMLSFATMLVNTNDGFSGATAIDISTMLVGDNQSFKQMAFDAGTEANSEAQGTIPGPADGGEGFNAARDDVNFVAGHAGVVSVDDGLSSSVLNVTHKFDNPVIAVTITRIQ